jgi:pre-mRNA-splicing factor CWC22
MILQEVYRPAFKKYPIQNKLHDKNSIEYQRITWNALKKSFNGLINKMNFTNLKNLLPEVFHENLVRGRGIFCRSLMKSQAISQSFTPIYAAHMSVINTKFPEIGLLILKRLVLRFREAFKHNDKPTCLSSVKFIAHLINQGLAHEMLALEIFMLLLDQPTDKGVEIAVFFAKEVGAALQELSSQGLHAICERFRNVIHSGLITKRVQYRIEGLFAIWRAGFDVSGYPACQESLDLIDKDIQIKHEISIDDEIEPEKELDIFSYDPNYEEHYQQYESFKNSVLGNDQSSKLETQEIVDVYDKTETNVVNLRRTIYLTIMSSLDFEEAGHKLLKIVFRPGQEIELIIMIIECCSQERTYNRYFGLLAQRFCYLSLVYQSLFEHCFEKQCLLLHRLEISKIRNVSKLFAHLLGSDAISWEVLTCIRLTMEDSSSSARIFIKILFQELAENIGVKKIKERIYNPKLEHCFINIFPKDSITNVRFSINFFTSIGLGELTDGQRKYLANWEHCWHAKKTESTTQI